MRVPTNRWLVLAAAIAGLVGLVWVLLGVIPGKPVPVAADPATRGSTDSAARGATDSAALGAETPAATVSPPRAGTPAQPAHPSATLASRLKTLPAETTQVVIVHSDSYASTYATVETFAKTGNQWRSVFAAMPARIGENGFSDTPAEGLAATPTGVYAFGDTMYGVAVDPGVRYPYHVLVQGDYWDENVASPGYNTFVHGANPGGASEPLWRSAVAYSHFAFITYNVPAVPGKGSGIFLHQSLGKPTAGCIGLSRTDLERVLTWLDPAAAPRIVLGPIEVLGRY